MVPKVLPEIKTLKAKLERGARWAPIQSNNLEGGVTIKVFLITE